VFYSTIIFSNLSPAIPSPIVAMLRGFRLGGRRLRLHRELIQVPLDALGVAAHLGAVGGEFDAPWH